MKTTFETDSKYKSSVLFGLTIFFCFFIQSCRSTKDYYNLPAKVTKTSFNAVIEIPAGTNKKYEYNNLQKAFIVDSTNGVERVIDFLPYPGNYGFIPSTLSKKEIGGDGDALDVLIISSSLPTKTVVEILPIAILKLIDNGQMDYKIIAVPKDESQRIIKAKSYLELNGSYPNLVKIIELWFLNYNKKDISSLQGWGNENDAIKEIELHLKN